MQAALAALHSSQQSRQPTPSFSGLPSSSLTTPSALPPPDLDPLRLRLVQLIDALTTLHSHLAYLQFTTPTPSSLSPGTLPFPDLVQRYQLLLTHLAAVQGLLSSRQDIERDEKRERDEGIQASRKKREERKRDAKRERWDAVSVVPATEVDEGRDWIVGMLLRTKQTPEVESHHSALLSSLPAPFSDALKLSSDPSLPDASPSAFPDALALQSQLLADAFERVEAVRRFEDREEGNEWEWKARVGLDEVGEGEGEGEGDEGEGDRMQEDKKEEKEEGGARVWTAKEVQTFLRTGRKPDL
ncbi:hypothetical protein JCM8097_000904 [Rhodosporidiobolus ruineniae]